MISEPAPTDWDVTIERAQHGGHIEEKLIRTAKMLTSAVQRSRLRGDADQVDALSERLRLVHHLLDQVA